MVAQLIHRLIHTLWLEAAQADQVSLGARKPIGSLLSVHLNLPGAGSVIHFTGDGTSADARFFSGSLFCQEVDGRRRR